MKRLAAAALLAAVPATAQDRPRSDAAKLSPYKLIMVGDSTMAPMSGWASAFCAHHVKSSTACLNLGRGGRSTRSYRQEGSWDIALNEARVAGYRTTYVLIQFGHNDQSTVPERWTDLAREFGPNLRRFVVEVRGAHAIPVLLTPLTRRDFKGGKLVDTLEPWAEEIRKVAADMDVPLVDLHRQSAALVQAMGAERAAGLAQMPPTAAERLAARAGTTMKARPFPETVSDPSTRKDGPRARFRLKFDYTHVGDAGAEVFAALVADALVRSVPDLRSQIAP